MLNTETNTDSLQETSEMKKVLLDLDLVNKSLELWKQEMNKKHWMYSWQNRTQEMEIQWNQFFDRMWILLQKKNKIQYDQWDKFYKERHKPVTREEMYIRNPANIYNRWFLDRNPEIELIY